MVSEVFPYYRITDFRRAVLDGAYSISFRLYYQTIREGRVTDGRGWGYSNRIEDGDPLGWYKNPRYNRYFPHITGDLSSSMETLSGISVLPYYLFFGDSIRRPHREGGSCVCCARSVSGSLYSSSIPRDRPSSMVPILSPFGCIYQTIRRGESNRMERDPIRWGRSVLGSPSYPEG